MMLKFRTLRGPAYVQIELTEDCTNSCRHCYNHFRHSCDTPSRVLTMPLAQEITRQVVAGKVFSVVLTGGEPMMNFSVLAEMTEQLTGNGISVNLNSNLVLATERRLSVLWDSGLRTILTSLLGPDAQTHDELAGRRGAFNAAVRGLKAAVNKGFRVSVNQVLTTDNFDTCYETGRLAAGLGAVSFSATKQSPSLGCPGSHLTCLTTGQARESLDVLLAIQRDFGIRVDVLESYPLCLLGDLEKYAPFAQHKCTAGITSCAIGADGAVRPCAHADTVYGNIQESGLLHCWNEMDDWRAGSYIPSQCQDCPVAGSCRGGCRMEAKYHGDISGLDPYAAREDAPAVVPTSAAGSADVDGEIRVNPVIAWREEDFGLAAYSRQTNLTFLGRDGERVFRAVLAHGPVSVGDLCAHMAWDRQAARNAVSRLIEKRILMEGGETCG